MLDPDIKAHYERVSERDRLVADGDSLELVRSREILARFLPPPPASVLDVGGGAGTYAGWLALQEYTVRLVDPVPLHVEQATTLAAAQTDAPFTAVVGDARQLAEPDGAYDAVLLMGPLYHLVERDDRLAALGEARRVVRPGGLVVVAIISRFASLLDGLRMGALTDSQFRTMAEADVQSGVHRNPAPEQHPEWFTTAYLQRPEGLRAEIEAAGLTLKAMLGIEGPGWLLADRWHDPAQRPSVLQVARATESEPSLLGASAHVMAIAEHSP